MARIERRAPMHRRWCKTCDDIHEKFEHCPGPPKGQYEKWSFDRKFDPSVTAEFKALYPDRECAKCGASGDTTFEIDHIKPVSKGGGHEVNNLQWLCLTCHKYKTKFEVRDYAAERRRQNRELAGYAKW